MTVHEANVVQIKWRAGLQLLVGGLLGVGLMVAMPSLGWAQNVFIVIFK